MLNVLFVLIKFFNIIVMMKVFIVWVFGNVLCFGVGIIGWICGEYWFGWWYVKVCLICMVVLLVSSCVMLISLSV